MKFSVQGDVAPGFEPVKALFTKNFTSGLEVAAQLCVYVKGQKVIDLWGARMEDSGKPVHGYGPQTVQNVFSSSKAVTSLVIAMLVDRGHLGYDKLVTDIWPEYGCNGKEGTTLRDIMRHEAGLPRLKGSVNAVHLTAEALKEFKVSNFISNQTPQTPPGSRQEYHAFSRGFILNEIVMRADPKGRTIGEFIREELARPLGLDQELFLGLSDEDDPSIAPVSAHPAGLYPEFLLPGFLGGRFATVSLATRLLWFFTGPILDKLFLSGQPQFIVEKEAPDQDGEQDGSSEPVTAETYNKPEVRAAELPSANMHCSARALALLAAVVVERGSVQGKPRVITEEGAAHAVAEAKPGRMCFGSLSETFGLPSAFTNAGWNDFKEARHGYTGWMGYGGSVMQWHEEERIAFGFALAGLEVAVQNSWKGEVLQAEVLKCVKATRGIAKY